MKRKIYTLWILVLLGDGCQSDLREPNQAVAEQPSAQLETGPAVQVASAALERGLVQTSLVEPRKWARSLELPAEVRRNEDRTMLVGAAVEGRVVRIFATVGSQVRENDLLAQLQTVTIDDLRARLAQALAELERSRSRLELAEAAWQRAQRLFELRVGSVRDLEEARAELQAAQADVRVVEAEVARIEETWSTSACPPPAPCRNFPCEKIRRNPTDSITENWSWYRSAPRSAALSWSGA